MSKLVKKGVDLGHQHRPVGSPLMQTQDILTQPPPELFNWVEPGSICRQADHLQARQAGQYTQDIRVRMNRPIILDDENALGLRIGLVKPLIQRSDLLASDDVVIQIGDLTAQGVQGANDTPLTVIGSTRQHSRGLRSSRYPVM